MAAAVFISYAREDAPIAEALHAMLEGWDISAFLDTKCIPPGADWANELDAEIDGCAVYVAFVSIEWKLSKWCKKEYVRAEARTERSGAPVVIPILVGAGVTPEISPIFKHHTPTGGEPIPRELTEEARRARLKTVVDSVRKSLAAQPPPPAPSPTTAAPADPPLPRRHPDLRLRHLPTTTFTARISSDELQWEVQDDGVNIGTWPAPAGGLRALLNADPGLTPTQLGDQIGHLLLKHAPQGWRDNPRNGPYASRRCQIQLDEPAALRIPWSWARLDGRWLAELGWTFEIAPTVTLTAGAHLGVHAPIVVIAPHAANDRCASMLDHIQVQLGAAGRSPAIVCRTASDLDRLAHLRPGFVIVVATSHMGRPSLDVAHGTSALNADAYDKLARLDGLQALVLIGLERPLLPTPAQRDAVPALISSPRAFHREEAGRTVPALVRALLNPDLDPTTAADLVAHTEPGVATNALITHRRWATWTTPPPPLNNRQAGSALREIDRELQRLAARDKVKRLTQSGTASRVLALVGLAATDEQLLAHALYDQLVTDLELNHPEIGVYRDEIHADLSQPQDRDVSNLEAWFAPSSGETPRERLAARAARLGSDRKVLWFNAGTVPLGQVTAERLVAWLVAFTRVFKAHLPTDLSVVVQIVGTHRDPEPMGMEIDEHARDIGAEQVEIETLPPLTHLTLTHIYKFLKLPEVSTCPIQHANAVAQAIFADKKGAFSETVEYIETLQADRFRSLIQRLTR